jgi:putative hydrolase of HD superfamily
MDDLEHLRAEVDDAKDLMAELLMPFKNTYRDMLIPTKVPGEWRLENDAEHSWSLAVLACCLIPRIDPSLDSGLVCELSVAHDIVERYAADTSVWASQAELDAKPVREAEARQKIDQRFSHFPWLTKTIDMYERKDTAEAQYVGGADKFIALAQRFTDGGKYWQERKITKEKYDVVIAKLSNKAHAHPGVGRYFDLIRRDYDSIPDQFYVEPAA